MNSTMIDLPDDFAGNTDHDMKIAMDRLAKATARVLRLANPGRDFSGAFREVGPSRASPGGLEIIGAGQTLFLRAGRYEIELYPLLSEKEEDRLLDDLLFKRERRQQRTIRDQSTGSPT